jgi:uncharacterized membrane protein
MFLAGSGVLHFLVPKFYDPLIPEQLPGSARSWVLGSGVAEIAVGAAVALPRTRRRGALAAFAVFIGVFPGNVKMLLDARAKPEPAPVQAALVARLPMQLPMLTWALRVRRQA